MLAFDAQVVQAAVLGEGQEPSSGLWLHVLGEKRHQRAAAAASTASTVTRSVRVTTTTLQRRMARRNELRCEAGRSRSCMRSRPGTLTP
eukprot:361603-Chlamydomonas_euryale.AAC.6